MDPGEVCQKDCENGSEADIAAPSSANWDDRRVRRRDTAISLKQSDAPPQSMCTFPHTPPKFSKGLGNLAFSLRITRYYHPYT